MPHCGERDVEDFRREGIARFQAGLPVADLDRIATVFGDPEETGSGLRLAGVQDDLLDWLRAHPALGAHASALLAAPARLVRVIAFDKSAAANWFVPWHQDRAIAVRRMHPAPGFEHWTRKDGYFQVEPPVALLERMTTLRLHLDDSRRSSGPLEVLPRSHSLGRLDRAGIAALVAQGEPRACLARRGEIIAMSPLIVHRSQKAARPLRRRVLHLEYCGADLPAGLDWAIAATAQQ